MTIEGWLWLDDYSSHRIIITQHPGATTYSYLFRINSTGAAFLTSTAYAAGATSTFVVPTKQWFHLAMIRDGAEITFILYDPVTGTNTEETITVSSSTADTSDGSLRISNGTNGWVGMMDDLRVWDVAKTNWQIRNKRMRPLTPAEQGNANLVGYWSHDDNLGSTVTDASATGADGTIVGTTHWVPTLEGSENLQGSPKPIAYGEPENCTPIKVDEAKLIYQYHDLEAQDLPAVYEGSFSITSGTEHTRTFRPSNHHPHRRPV